MYYGGGASCGCGGYNYMPYQTGYNYMPYQTGCCGNNSNYAIVLVLFILLVIVIGSRFSH